MNDDAEDTLDTLLKIVERDRDERCLEIRGQAQEEARRLVREARAQARTRVAEAVREARRRAQERLDDARAALATQARQRRQEASRALLERAWSVLPTALAERWQSPAARHRWLEAVVDLAAGSLPLGTWEITVPDRLGAEERERLAARIREITGEPPELSASDELAAGIRICVGSTCLDGTTTGLLADRRTVEGRLLAEMIHEVDGSEEAA